MSTLSVTQASCLCGLNKISFTGAPILKFKCHCTDELKLDGVGFALNILYPTDGFQVLSGKLVEWTKVADNGNSITNHSCGRCGSLIYRSTTGHPGTMVIKAGCVDGDAAREFVPQVEIFTRSRLPWVPAVEGAKQEIGDFTE